jgi:PLP dependent protein
VETAKSYFSSLDIRHSSFTLMSIADNLRRVKERIARAAEFAGRRADEITLVGVTKYVTSAEASELITAGCHHLGESRPQELWKKAADLSPGEAASAGLSLPKSAAGRTTITPPIQWHFIGHLQRNKVARTLPIVSLIHSVDSERLLAAINDAHTPVNDQPPIAVLLEVNTCAETAKNGLPPDEVEPLLAAASNYPHVTIRGLMTMAALEGGEAVAAKNFATLRQLRDRLKPNIPSCVQLVELSMGMSDDFEVAIKEGATVVRVGSALWETED